MSAALLGVLILGAGVDVRAEESAESAETPGEVTKPTPEMLEHMADVRRHFEKLGTASEKYWKLVEQAETDESVRKLIRASSSAWIGARQRFLEAFIASEWNAWDPEKDKPLLLTGLIETGQVYLHADPALSERAFEAVIAKYPEGSARDTACVWLPYAIAAQDRIEDALDRSRELSETATGTTKAYMHLYEGDLMTTLGWTKAAKKTYRASIEAAKQSPDLGNPWYRQALDGARVRLEMIGNPAPELDVVEWVGKGGSTFEDLRGRVVLVKFGNTCSSCCYTFARMADIQESRSDQPFAALGVMVPSSTMFLPSKRDDIVRGQHQYAIEREDFADMVKKFQKKLRAKYPIAVVEQSQLTALGVPGQELTIVVDTEGNVVFVDVAGQGLDLAQAVLDHLLGVRVIESRGAPEQITVVDEAPLEFEPLPEGPLDNAAFLEKETAYRAALDADAPELVARTLEYATALEKRLRHEEAADALLPVIEAHPGDVALLTLHARQKLIIAEATIRNPQKTGLVEARLDVAKECIDRATAADPEAVEPRLLEARWILARRDADPNDAKRMLEELAKKHPDRFDVHYALGVHWSRMARLFGHEEARWAGARAAFEKAHAIDGNHAGVWCNLTFAKEHLSEGTAQDRADGYERAVQLNPDVRLAYYELSLAAEPHEERPVDRLVRFLESPEAVQSTLDRLLSQHPQHPQLVRAKVKPYLESEDEEAKAEGLAILEAARAAAPTDPHLALAHGELLLPGTSEQRAEAVEHFVTAARLCRGSLDRRIYDQVDFHAARNADLSPDQRHRLWCVLYQEFPKEINAPTNAEVWFRDAMRDAERCLLWCNRALRIDPDDPMIHNDLGITFAEPSRHMDLELAEEHFVAAILGAKKKGIAESSKSLGYKNAVDNLANLLLGQGEDEKRRLIEFAHEHLQHDERFEAIVEQAKED